MVHLFLSKRHVDTWGVLLPMIWMAMKIYVTNWDVFFYGRSNMLLRTFGACSYTVNLLLFMSYCGRLYTSSIWCKYTKKQCYQIYNIYNNVFIRFFGYDRFSSASQMFVENSLKKQFSHTCMLNELCGMVKFWTTTKVGKCLYMQSWSNT